MTTQKFSKNRTNKECSMFNIITNQPFMSILIINVIAIALLSFTIHASFDCKQYKNGKCISCPSRAHLYNQICYNDIVGCQQYSNGTHCARCNSSISILVNNTCQLLSYLPFSKQQERFLRLRSDLYRKYGSNAFVQISIQQAQSNEYFKICDRWMRYNYEQSYRISKQSQPQLSIFSYIDNDRYNNNEIHFKIIYKGQDGGLYLCIISMCYNKTQMALPVLGKSIFLESFVSINKVNTDIHCIDFNIYGFCQGCNQGYHLQQGICYKNIGLCKSYYRNICLSCSGFSFLVDNRCIGNCQDITDCRNIAMNKLPKKQNEKKINIETFPCCEKKCDFREFLNSQGKCQIINPLCKSWDNKTGDCLSCYFGFRLSRGKCLF